MATHHPIRKLVPATPEIPDKLYFRIGDVARLCEVPAYVLRFWETEFPQLKPNKGGSGQRLYRRRDVEMAMRIKSLLYDQGYTIPGARQVFKNETRPAELGPTIASSALAEAEVAPVPAMEAATVSTPRLTPVSDAERDRTLNALRAEMRSLLNQLAKPVPAAHTPLESKVQTMRPRLVLEKPAMPRLETTMKPKLQITPQRDLFGVSDDGNDGPMAC
ncbi:MAG: MerR family transcriptional regulator [Acidobacteriaceae bacterium]|nr:MerR family transcriptional regulator [Acidobacteriaceae bacterium]